MSKPTDITPCPRCGHQGPHYCPSPSRGRTAVAGVNDIDIDRLRALGTPPDRSVARGPSVALLASATAWVAGIAAVVHLLPI